MATSNSKARFKMHVKKGDLVQVISGKDRGKTGKIQQVIPEKSQVLIEGVNVRTYHRKPSGEQAGQIQRKEAPIHSSKVMLYSEKQKTASRVGYVIAENGAKTRVLKKTGEKIS
ncbi:MAG: 50S ribosomal protein L24 [Gloeobacterales cyanobacterium]